MTKVDKWIQQEQGKHFCICGCGQEIVIKRCHHWKSRGISKYIYGHSSVGKNNPFYGRHLSKDHKRKISESEKGKKISEEHKKIISEANKGKKNPFYGKKLSEEHMRKLFKANKGKHRSKETKLKLSKANKGKNHPQWKGGISFEPYCIKFNNELKNKIRNRDNNICQNCSKTKEENGNKNLCVHHIHYDKENCYPDLITVCNNCNLKANHNRDYWEEYYMNILEKRGLLNHMNRELNNKKYI